MKITYRVKNENVSQRFEFGTNCNGLARENPLAS